MENHFSIPRLFRGLYVLCVLEALEIPEVLESLEILEVLEPLEKLTIDIPASPWSRGRA